MCDNGDKTMGKLKLVSALLPVETMRASEELLRRRKGMHVRDTFGTNNPKGNGNLDGTRR